MSKKQKIIHIHKVRRHIYTRGPQKGREIYFCTFPDCEYKIDIPLSLGKEFLCNTCNKPFLFNERTICLAKPHCLDCTRGKIKFNSTNPTNNGANNEPTISSTSTAKDILSRLRPNQESLKRIEVQDAASVLNSDSDLDL